MEKYTKAQMEIIEFEAEDVITTSSIPIGCVLKEGCTNNEPPTPDGDGWIWGE